MNGMNGMNGFPIVALTANNNYNQHLLLVAKSKVSITMQKLFILFITVHSKKQQH